MKRHVESQELRPLSPLGRMRKKHFTIIIGNHFLCPESLNLPLEYSAGTTSVLRYWNSHSSCCGSLKPQHNQRIFFCGLRNPCEVRTATSQPGERGRSSHAPHLQPLSALGLCHPESLLITRMLQKAMQGDLLVALRD